MITENPARIRLGRIAPTLGVNDIEASYCLYNALFDFEKAFEKGDPVGFMILKRDDAELH